MKTFNTLCLLSSALPLLAFGGNITNIQLVNNSGFDDKEVYFIATALDDKGQQCFIELLENNSIDCEAVNANTDPSDYSYSFASVKNKNLQIPYISSGRMYISVGAPLVFYIDHTGAGIVHPNPLNPTDPNVKTYFDKIEFSHAENAFFINPTAVDFFGLPITIENPDANPEGYQQVGLTQSFQEVFNNFINTFTDEDVTEQAEWQKLFVYYDTDKKQALRIHSPGKAMIDNIFNRHYLDDEETFGFNYIQFVWDHYKNHELKINNGTQTFIGQVDKNNVFVFKDENRKEIIAQLEKPADSLPFFAGAQGTFAPDGNLHKDEIVRDLTSAFVVGFLPAPHDAVLSEHYFKELSDLYYTDNPILKAAGVTGGPWFDLYGKALHANGDLIYSFAYDDRLGLDGTMTVLPGVTTPTTITVNNIIW